MTNSSKQELVFTPELVGYAQAVARKMARRRVPRFLGVDDAVQHVMLQLVQFPPKFDPSRGTSPKTLLYAAVGNGISDFLKRHYRHQEHHEELSKPDLVPERVISRREAAKRLVEEMLALIKDKESRELCLLVLECEGNMSQAARRLGKNEGTIRYRLELLELKLKAMGFNPFPIKGK
jgi:RNA polymerase sigma factor (sigma-70 family)